MNGDGAGERHGGAPRMLEIQNFAAARSAEVQALYEAVKDQVKTSGGDPSSFTIARHLRRRTTSHNRRVPYWILNERKKTREGQTAQKRKKTRQNEPPSAPGNSEKRKVERPLPCRRVRRRIEFRRVRQGEDIVQPDGTRRLATHVWHAKRFRMTKCWGYYLPEGLAGRGRASRAVLKWVDEAAVLHDASYYGLIELQGTSEAIARSLQQTVEPTIWSPNSGSPVKKAEAHGLLSGNAVLYQFGKAPYDAIGPITFLWRPPTSGLKQRATDLEQAEGDVTQDERQLWIWVHPGAYESALQCLSTACERQGDRGTHPVKCRSRRSDLARLEIIGSKATEVIRKVIHPTSRKFGNSPYKTTCQLAVRDSDCPSPCYSTDCVSGQPSNVSFLSKAECLPPSAVLALDVMDPRGTSSYNQSVLKSEGGVGDDGAHMERRECISQTQGEDADVLEGRDQNGDGSDCVLDDEDGLNYSASWLSLGERGLSREVSDNECLWNSQEPQCTWSAPMTEKTLSKKRHEVRSNFLRAVNQDYTAKSAESCSKDQLDTSSVCPVLLLKGSKSLSSACGWTIIMPMRWVQAFWVPLVFAGGHVIGLRERHWVATNAGIPHFPHDSPDCSAYAQLLAASIAASQEVNRKRPPAKRCPCAVVSPLQVSILRVFEANSRSSGSFNADVHVTREVEEPYDASAKAVDVERHEKSSARGSVSVEETVSHIFRGEPTESHNDDKVVRCAIDSAHMIGKQGIESLIPYPRSNGECLLISQSSRGTEQTMLQNVDSVFRPGEALSSEARLGVSLPSSSGAAFKAITDERSGSDDQTLIPDGTVSGWTNQEGLYPMEETKTQLAGGFSASLMLESGPTESRGAVERLPTNGAMTVEIEGSDVVNDIEPVSGECEGVASGNILRISESMDYVAENEDRAAHSGFKLVERSSLSFFVARTQNTLLQTLNQSGFRHALFLHQGITSRGTISDALRQETVRWSALQEASNISERTSVCISVSGEERVCYVRVLVSVPRKGVMEEGAVIFVSSSEDRDTFLRSKDWQGPSVVYPRNVKRKRKDKGKQVGVMSLDDDASSHGTVLKTNGTYENADAFCEAWGNNRKSIGFVTSAIPRGSTGPCIGFCDVGALMKLRAAQSGDQRWWNRRDIFVLAGNKYSSKLRPALISIPLERAEEDVEWL